MISVWIDFNPKSAKKKRGQEISYYIKMFIVYYAANASSLL